MITIQADRELTEEELDELRDLLKEKPPEDEKLEIQYFLKDRSKKHGGERNSKELSRS